MQPDGWLGSSADLSRTHSWLAGGWSRLAGLSSSPLHMFLMVQQASSGILSWRWHIPKRAQTPMDGPFWASVTCLLTAHWPKPVTWLSPAPRDGVDPATHCGKARQSHMAKGLEERRGEDCGRVSYHRWEWIRIIFLEREGQNSKCRQCIHPFWEVWFSTGNTKLCQPTPHPRLLEQS